MFNDGSKLSDLARTSNLLNSSHEMRHYHHHHRHHQRCNHQQCHAAAAAAVANGDIVHKVHVRCRVRSVTIPLRLLPSTTISDCRPAAAAAADDDDANDDHHSWSLCDVVEVVDSFISVTRRSISTQPGIYRYVQVYTGTCT